MNKYIMSLHNALPRILWIFNSTLLGILFGTFSSIYINVYTSAPDNLIVAIASLIGVSGGALCVYWRKKIEDTFTSMQVYNSSHGGSVTEWDVFVRCTVQEKPLSRKVVAGFLIMCIPVIFVILEQREIQVDLGSTVTNIEEIQDTGHSLQSTLESGIKTIDGLTRQQIQLLEKKTEQLARQQTQQQENALLQQQIQFKSIAEKISALSAQLKALELKPKSECNP